ncbi:MAG: hypothetical protein C4542_03145 [Dehalococcoidia bacterium]|nr:MAG: hypothetical protein C4542_03145 [Dehalococcoidia bacterium]
MAAVIAEVVVAAIDYSRICVITNILPPGFFVSMKLIFLIVAYLWKPLIAQNIRAKRAENLAIHNALPKRIIGFSPL